MLAGNMIVSCSSCQFQLDETRPDSGLNRPRHSRGTYVESGDGSSRKGGQRSKSRGPADPAAELYSIAAPKTHNAIVASLR